MVKQYDAVKLALPKAIAQANTVLTRAASVSALLKRYDVTLTVPAVEK